MIILLGESFELVPPPKPPTWMIAGLILVVLACMGVMVVASDFWDVVRFWLSLAAVTFVQFLIVFLCWAVYEASRRIRLAIHYRQVGVRDLSKLWKACA